MMEHDGQNPTYLFSSTSAPTWDTANCCQTDHGSNDHRHIPGTCNLSRGRYPAPPTSPLWDRYPDRSVNMGVYPGEWFTVLEETKMVDHPSWAIWNTNSVLYVSNQQCIHPLRHHGPSLCIQCIQYLLSAMASTFIYSKFIVCCLYSPLSWSKLIASAKPVVVVTSRCMMGVVLRVMARW